jgi:multicomponent Na+:H+ antiporter subunit B
MIKRYFALLLVIGFGYILYMAMTEWQPNTELKGVAHDYVQRETDELGAMNLVTAIVVTYRGLDTLGEVAVLFLAASGIALLMRRRKNIAVQYERRPSSEFLQTGSALLAPPLMMLGACIFLNGHLSPGGGFQGGAVIASAVLLLFMGRPGYRPNHALLEWIESISGLAYVGVGILGLFFAGGFLDNRILPLGEFGKILSAGAIPVIYTFIGLKVGTELAGILDNLKNESLNTINDI